MKRLKEVLAPTWSKIITSLLIFLLIPVIPVKLILMDADPLMSCFSVLRLLTMEARNRPFVLWSQAIVFLPVFAFAAIYLLVGILANKIPWADLIRFFREFAKPDKAKIIIFAIGMSTMPGFILMYIGGLYGGLMGLTESLRRIYSLYNNFYFELIAIPVTIISFLFYNIGSFIIIMLSIITFGTGLNISNPFYLANYSIVVALVLFAIMAIEWYLFACTAVAVFRKIKGRRQNNHE